MEALSKLTNLENLEKALTISKKVKKLESYILKLKTKKSASKIYTLSITSRDMSYRDEIGITGITAQRIIELIQHQKDEELEKLNKLGYTL